MELSIKLFFCTVSSFIVSSFGGWDVWLTSLLSLIVIDIITGIIKSLILRSDKSKSGGLNSAAMFIGGLKKVLILILVAVGVALDRIIPLDGNNIRIIIVSYYIANESLSILENMGACGIPLPKILFNILDTLKNKNSNGK